MLCNVFTQRIQRLHNNANLNPIYEILIRPKNQNTEQFYSSMGSSDSLEFAKQNIECLQRNAIVLLRTCHDAAYFSINVECKNLIQLKGPLVRLNRVLSQYGVRLIIELTERERLFCEPVLSAIKYFHDKGIKLFVDDLSATEFGSISVNLDYIAGIKIRLTDLKDFPNGFEFVGELLSMGKVVVVENVEDENQLEQCVKNAVNFVQGYHVSMPKEVFEFESLEMCHHGMLS